MTSGSNTQRCFKSSFPLISMTDTNIVVSPTNVELGEVVGVMQLVNEDRDEGKRSCILDSDIIKTSVVLYRADITSTKVIRNIIFQGSGFTRSEAIDRTFPKCGARD